MDDQLDCRLRVAGDVFDLAGPPAALRELADRLRAGGPLTQRIRNGALRQEPGEGPAEVTLLAGPTLRVGGDVAALWAALDTVAAEADAGDDKAHRHIGALTVTAAEPVDPLAGLG